jgi:hypothetical protein
MWALVAVSVVAMAALAGGIAFGGTATCTNAGTLNGSAFEIDANANQTVEGPGSGCKDWLNTGPGSGPIIKQDSQSGSGDESFGEGTKEDTALPTVVDGSIPPNKSDLKAFGVYTETGEVKPGNPTGKFLELLWTRVQDPSGTTNMDFELNQKLCDLTKTPTNCAPNGLTPLRTSGDKLITYDLSRGGTVATISIRTWNGSAWGNPTVLTGSSALARGTVNTTGISSLNSLPSLGALDPRTFGEASISFGALFGENTCGQFGSAYLKSRSSDSFTAALKDFVPPQAVTISNCAALTTTASNNTQASAATIGGSISDTATLSGVAPGAGGSITFKAYGPDNTDCSGTAAFTSSAIPVSGNGNYSSGSFTPTAVGTFRWTASYTGDANNQPASSGCNAAGETSFVIKASPQIETTPQPSSGTVGTTLNDSASSPCNAENESSLVNKASANVDTSQELFPQDSATLSASAGGTPTGTVDFALYGPNDANCSGTPVYTENNVMLDNGTANTDNTNFSVNAAGSGNYKWKVTYSGDAKHDGATSACGKEAFTATIDNDTSN